MSEIEADTERVFDFWGDRLGIRCGGYSSEVDQQVLSVAELIVASNKFMTDIAHETGLTEEHVELIQYILASVHYEPDPGKNYYSNHPFTYGTSPRGLFVSNPKSAERFLAEFREHMKSWEEDR